MYGPLLECFFEVMEATHSTTPSCRSSNPTSGLEPVCDLQAAISWWVWRWRWPPSSGCDQLDMASTEIRVITVPFSTKRASVTQLYCYFHHGKVSMTVVSIVKVAVTLVLHAETVDLQWWLQWWSEVRVIKPLVSVVTLLFDLLLWTLPGVCPTFPLERRWLGIWTWKSGNWEIRNSGI